MTKQEAIREGLISKVKSIRNWRNKPDIDPLSAEDDAGDILNYLHNNDVVIKVDGELPRLTEKSTGIEYIKIDGYWTQAGYEAVEPLIEEKIR